ncbi:OLC1v1028747C3 [Oldenlandia corymbosa var. corymbosa]|nr:OLC1v1028747C3 [Oldenlandia corymbosa var. corymbosa]
MAIFTKHGRCTWDWGTRAPRGVRVIYYKKESAKAACKDLTRFPRSIRARVIQWTCSN